MVNLVAQLKEKNQKKELEKERRRRAIVPVDIDEAEDVPKRTLRSCFQSMILHLKRAILPKKKPRPMDHLSYMEERDKKLLTAMKFKKKEKKKLFSKWNEMVGEEGKINRKMNFESFIFYFGLKDETWTRRLFDIMNASLSGKVTFNEFLIFVEQFLLVQKTSTNELGFRLVSRR